MDYTESKTIFKIKKVLRFSRLYGLKRTIVKVKGQYHMKRQYNTLPTMKAENHPGHVGVMGCGNYAFSNIGYYLKKNYGNVIRGTMDIDINHAASLCNEYKGAYYTDDPARIANDPSIDTVYIASNHATHAEYAIMCLEQGKNVHIEKPHSVRFEQLERLIAAEKKSTGKILSIGYNRPRSDIGNTIKKYLSAEKGAAMLNWFIAGHELDPDHWYFKKEEGGRVLGNLCHWTDFTYQMIDEESRYPLTIIPTRSEKSDCDIAVTYVFGDGSIAAITFSAKGHTFEGVREKFSAHRGDVLISMDDFQSLKVEIVDKRVRLKPLFRDHGHERSICTSYEASIDPDNSGQSIKYVWEAAQLFLRTRDALENNEKLIINGADDLGQ